MLFHQNSDLQLLEVEGRVHHLAVALPVVAVDEDEALAEERLQVGVEVVLGEQTRPLREHLLHQVDVGDADARHGPVPVQKSFP